MSWEECQILFQLLGRRLKDNSLVFTYGPFNYDGKFTSQSNQEFDQYLKKQNSVSGIRNFEEVCEQMKQAGFSLHNDHEMPANNRLLVFSNAAN